MTTSPRLGMTELEAGQAIPESRVNFTDRIHEQGASLFGGVLSIENAPPGSPADGDAHIIGTGSGAWAGKDDQIAIRVSTAWEYLDPMEGFFAWNADDTTLYLYSSGAWGAYTPSGTGGTAGTLDFDTDGTLAANSDLLIATQKAVKTYIDLAVTGLWEIKSDTDCSANPNYPAALKGDAHVVTVAGKIGGASGKSVDVGDVFVAKADNAGGTEASVGTSWFVIEHNLAGVLLLSGGTLTGALVVPADVYGAGWNGSNEVPTKNDVYDKIEAIVAGIPGSYTDEMARDAIAAMILAGNGLDVTYNDGADTFTIDVDVSEVEATTVEMWTGSSSTKAVTPKKILDAAAPQALTDGATVTPDFNAGFNFEWTIGGNRTLANPSNAKSGQSGTIKIVQDATGTRVITYGNNWRFPGGSATGGVLSTAANAIDLIAYTVGTDGKIYATLSKAFAA